MKRKKNFHIEKDTLSKEKKGKPDKIIPSDMIINCVSKYP